MASVPIYRIFGTTIRHRSRLLCQHFYRSSLVNNHWNQTLSLSSSSNGKEKFRIYTRTGDSGTSGLFTGERRPKDDAIFEALGTTDELTSSIGLAREFINDPIILDELEQIQCILQDLQATVATPKSSSNEFQLQIHTDKLPPLRNFILPSGGKAASSLHLARAICRRAERRLIPLLDEGLELPVVQYLNRLSSYLFIVARVCCQQEGHKEVVYWERPKYNRQNDDDDD
ncbi:corrinoid adenosyltransferase MMAB-like [Dermatophagoides pteronyssinus]|uniref:corrinoid adenosyltransferase MMAB-like n=1 Tax=Dermatophagoides pteronyssinus TaxID=6956 RepID=UPI003F675E9E